MRKLLKNRRGESLVEILVAGVVFLILLGTLRAGIHFAAGSLVKAQTLQAEAFQYQQSARKNLADGTGVTENTSVPPVDFGDFKVPVKLQTVEATAKHAYFESPQDDLPKETEIKTYFQVYASPEEPEAAP